MIEVRDLWHRYDGPWALKAINIELLGRGVVGLLGPNGAGKSTFMNIISGCLSNTRGEVRVAGNLIRSSSSDNRRLLGFLPQRAPLSFELTVLEYLRFCAALRGVPATRLKEHIDLAMERCDLVSMRHRLIGNLSGGFRQRVGIAQAIVHQPQLVILDEPTVGLDPVQILGVRDLITDIGRDCTILISTHVLTEVDALCRNVLMIDMGELVFAGTIDEFRAVSSSSSLVASLARPPSIDSLQSILPFVEAIEVIDQDALRLRVAIETTDAVEAFSRASLDEGWGLREIYFERPTLEQAFNIITGKDQPC